MAKFRAGMAVLGLSVAVVLAGCVNAPPAPKLEQADFSAFSPIVLNVGRIDVQDRSRRPAGSVDGRLSLPPNEAIKQWAHARLRAQGGDGVATVIIKEAAITEAQLAKTGGMKGMFTNDQTARYDTKVAVDVVVDKPSLDSFRGSTTANATRFVTLAENVTLEGREIAIQNLATKVVEDLNTRLDAGIRRDLARVVTR